MLKDITLGQFFPADTPVHRLDPRTKLLCVILYIVALFSAKSVLTYGIMITVLAVSVLVSRVPFKSLTKGLKPVYFVVAFTAVMNMFFTAGTPVADVWLLRSITWEGVVAAVQMVLRIVMLIMGYDDVYRAAVHSHADRGDRQDHVGTEGPRRGL